MATLHLARAAAECPYIRRSAVASRTYCSGEHRYDRRLPYGSLDLYRRIYISDQVPGCRVAAEGVHMSRVEHIRTRPSVFFLIRGLDDVSSVSLSSRLRFDLIFADLVIGHVPWTMPDGSAGEYWKRCRRDLNLATVSAGAAPHPGSFASPSPSSCLTSRSGSSREGVETDILLCFFARTTLHRTCPGVGSQLLVRVRQRHGGVSENNHDENYAQISIPHETAFHSLPASRLAHFTPFDPRTLVP